MLNILIDEITEKEILLEGEVPSDDFPQLKKLADEGVASFPEPLGYRLGVSRLAGIIEVSGEVNTVVELNCSRCLTSYRTPVSSFLSLAYTQQLPEFVTDEDEETELSAEDMGLTLLEGDEISLTEALQEQVLISLPIQPLCQDECEGLCLLCGCNLNESSCDCTEPQFDDRFASLKNFKVNK